jgi:cytochrome bd-type quinol oxidase subunit 2
MTQVLDFVPLWTVILGLAVFFYVLLDGFDSASECCSVLRPIRLREIQS